MIQKYKYIVYQHKFHYIDTGLGITILIIFKQICDVHKKDPGTKRRSEVYYFVTHMMYGRNMTN